VGDTVSTPDRDRFDLIHDEWLEDYLDRSTAYLKTACGIDVPPEPEVMAILAAWENGNGDLPWSDASAGLRLIPSTSHGEDESE
jgi:hypothetical protein